jgi:DNA-binding sugar fermentation-stimulating protein
VALTLHRQADPNFATTLELAVARGVEVKALTCRVSQDEIELAHEVPVILGQEDLD